MLIGGEEGGRAEWAEGTACVTWVPWKEAD